MTDHITLRRYRFEIAYRNSFLRAVYSKYPSIFSDSGSLFIHVPKVAGISICLSIYGQEVGHQMLRYYEACDREKTNKAFKFAFIRNPWDRLVSAYLFLKAGGMQKYKGDKYFSGLISRSFSSFEIFVRDWLTPTSVYTFNHFIPQLEFILNRAGTIGMDYIGRYEALDDDLAVVFERLGIQPHLEWKNKTDKSDYRQYYSHKWMIEKVGVIYEKDINAFGYEF